MTAERGAARNNGGVGWAKSPAFTTRGHCACAILPTCKCRWRAVPTLPTAESADLTTGVRRQILYHMVKYNTQPLDRTFAALADPTRRALLARLGEHDAVSVSELARPIPVSLPAIMKHLDVLSDAGLITRAKTGRTVACRLSAAPMEQAMEWLNRYQRFWSTQLDRLAAFVEEDAC